MKQLEDLFSKYLLIKDKNVIKTMVANFIANQFNGYPNWLFLVAPSSGGKSELIQAFNTINSPTGRQMVFPISDMTANALASGQKKVGQETSLLHQIPPGGLMVYKDFTSMLSKNKEAQAEIFKQLREVYDGQYIKRTGTGNNVNWAGKIGAMAGATEAIYEYQAQFSAMGDRFIMYNVIQPDRREVLDFIMHNSRINADRKEQQTVLQAGVKSYVENLLKTMTEEDIVISEELKENIKDVADFCTRVRSGVMTDERRPNIINFVPAIEMPIRMIHQLINLAKAFIVIRRLDNPLGPANTDQITEDEALILYKIAFDSIPIKRRMALKALAKYSGGVSTKGLATEINYQTAVVASWLAQLNALNICSRQIGRGNKGDIWNLKEQYREVMVKFEKIEVTNESLIDEDDEEEDYSQGLDALSELDKKAEMESLDVGNMGADFGF